MESQANGQMEFRLPPSLQRHDDAEALAMLKAYYGPSPGQEGFFTGSLFDTWDSTGQRDAHANEFTADDLLAVSLLSVRFEAAAVHELLLAKRQELSRLLELVGPDRELASTADDINPKWPAWQLNSALRGIDDVGPTKASKLMARKRPRLIPIYDSVVGLLTNTTRSQWVPLRAALQADGGVLNQRLANLAGQAGLNERVSPLRVLDVIAWMDGIEKHRERALQEAVPRQASSRPPRQEPAD